MGNLKPVANDRNLNNYIREQSSHELLNLLPELVWKVKSLISPRVHSLFLTIYLVISSLFFPVSRK